MYEYGMVGAIASTTTKTTTDGKDDEEEEAYQGGVLPDGGSPTKVGDRTTTTTTPRAETSSASSRTSSKDGWVTPDYAKARELYSEAWSKVLYPPSGYNLALMLAYGRGGPQDYSRALDIFKSAATQFDHAPSARYLGILAFGGQGLPNGVADYKMAMGWFAVCAKMQDETVSEQCAKDRDWIKQAVKEAQDDVNKRAALFGEDFASFQLEPMAV